MRLLLLCCQDRDSPDLHWCELELVSTRSPSKPMSICLIDRNPLGFEKATEEMGTTLRDAPFPLLTRPDDEAIEQEAPRCNAIGVPASFIYRVFVPWSPRRGRGKEASVMILTGTAANVPNVPRRPWLVVGSRSSMGYPRPAHFILLQEVRCPRAGIPSAPLTVSCRIRSISLSYVIWYRCLGHAHLPKPRLTVSRLNHDDSQGRTRTGRADRHQRRHPRR